MHLTRSPPRSPPHLSLTLKVRTHLFTRLAWNPAGNRSVQSSLGATVSLAPPFFDDYPYTALHICLRLDMHPLANVLLIKAYAGSYGLVQVLLLLVYLLGSHPESSLTPLPIVTFKSETARHPLGPYVQCIHFFPPSIGIVCLRQA